MSGRFWLAKSDEQSNKGSTTQRLSKILELTEPKGRNSVGLVSVIDRIMRFLSNSHIFEAEIFIYVTKKKIVHIK